MEVSGARKETSHKFSLSHGSAEGVEYSCQSCIYEGHVVEAEGFCQNCREYLCDACIRYHRKAAQSRRHVILNKNEMPKGITPRKETIPCTEICSKHSPEVVKFFCKHHDMVGCGDCIVLWHKNCKVDYIPDLAENPDSSSEYHSLLEKIQALETKVVIVGSDLEQNADEVLNAYNTALEDIKNKRRKINECLDKAEQEIIAQSARIRQENEMKENSIREATKRLKFEFASVRSRLELHAKQPCDLYIAVKQSIASLVALEQDLDSLTWNSKFQVCMLEEGVDMNMFECQPFGQLESMSNNMLVLPAVMLRHKNMVVTADFTKEITNVGPVSNDTACEIAGMVSLSQDTLAFADTFHKSVKLIDSSQDLVTTELQLTSEPADITKITFDELAVTLPDEKKITFVSLKKRRELTKSRSFNTSDKCRFIDYSNGKFVVSYQNPAKVEILDLQGTLLNVLKTDRGGAEMFQYPESVAFGHDMQSIFVSDYRLKAVFKLTLDGKKLATYKDSLLSSPEGLTVCKDGTLFVAGVINGTVHHISSDCRKIKLLIEDKQILPRALCLNKNCDTLYMSYDNVEMWIDEMIVADRKIRIYKLNN